jgi:hypothetical protein
VDVSDVMFVLGCFRCMLKVFHQDVAYVAMAIYIRCKPMFQVFQVFQTYVSSVLFGCCIICILQEYVSSVLGVSYICCKCFI